MKRHNADRMLKNRSVVVVLGMHRAGTSLLMNALSRMGLEAGDDLLQGDEANAEGYWELREIFTLQDQVLEQVGRRWDAPSGVLPFPHGWVEQSEVQSLGAALADVLQRRLLKHTGTVGFKDPRTALLLPLWDRIFTDLGLTPVYVLATRDPGAVAQSLERRGFPVPHGLLLWARTYASVLAHAADRCKAVIDYDEWFEDPRGTVNRLQHALAGAGVQLSAAPDVAAELVKPSLRHWGGHGALEVPAFVAELYRLLRQAAADPRELVNAAESWDARELEERARAWQSGDWGKQRFVINALDQAQKQVFGHGRIEPTHVDEGRWRARCIFMHPTAGITLPIRSPGPDELRLGLGLHPEMRADPRAGVTRVRILLDGREVGESTLSYQESTPEQPWREEVFGLPAGAGNQRLLTIEAKPADGGEDFHWLMLREPVIAERSVRSTADAPSLAGAGERLGATETALRASDHPVTLDGSLRNTLDIDHVSVPRIELLDFMRPEPRGADRSAVSVIVDVRHGTRFLRTLLPTLKAQRGLGPVSVLVADCAGDPEVGQMAQRYGGRLWRGTEPDSLAMGDAVPAGTEYVVLLPDDALPTSREWLHDLLAALRCYRAKAVSCRELPRQGVELYGSVRCQEINEQLFASEGGDRMVGPGQGPDDLYELGIGADRVWLAPREILAHCRPAAKGWLECALEAMLGRHGQVVLLANPAVTRSFQYTPYGVLRACVRGAGAGRVAADPDVKAGLAYMRALRAALRSADDVPSPEELKRAVERATEVYIPSTSGVEELEAVTDPGVRDLLLEALSAEHEAPVPGGEALVAVMRDRLLEIAGRIGQVYPTIDERILEQFRGCVQNVFAEALGQHIAAVCGPSSNTAKAELPGPTHQLGQELQR